MNRFLYYSVFVTSAVLAGVAFSSCNKDDVIEPDPEPEPPVVTPPPSFEGVKVYDYTPAPGQFINEGDASAFATPEAAAGWAQERINTGLPVSLGAFGGYIVLGLDHSIEATVEAYDFYVAGNAFVSTMGGSNEPGIVWVMHDANGNGRPDDIWYELAGSDTFDPATRRRFSVTYHRPAAPAMDVVWEASDGTTGSVSYLPQFHKQDYYYPAWLEADSYTLEGTLLSPNNSLNPTTGYWNNKPYGWGYADNVGSDNIEAAGQCTGFKILNAIDADGNNVRLDRIDFVKIQSGVLANSGILGEISTEVCGFGEYPAPL